MQQWNPFYPVATRNKACFLVIHKKQNKNKNQANRKQTEESNVKKVDFSPVSLGKSSSYSTGSLWNINTSIISHLIFKYTSVSNKMSQCFPALIRAL